MQTVIFVAGEGTRLRPLTETKPKPLVEVAGRPIIEHIFRDLPGKIDEVILVIGYKGDMIRDYFGDEYEGIKIKYVVQEKQLGTFNALKTAEHLIRDEPFLCLMGDDFHSKKGFEKLTEYDYAMLVAWRDDVRSFGLAKFDDDMILKELIEKPENHEGGGYVFTGATTITREIFKEPPVYKKNGEDVLPPMIGNLSAKYPVKVLKSDFWFPIAYPEDVEKAEKLLSNK